MSKENYNKSFKIKEMKGHYALNRQGQSCVCPYQSAVTMPVPLSNNITTGGNNMRIVAQRWTCDSMCPMFEVNDFKRRDARNTATVSLHCTGRVIEDVEVEDVKESSNTVPMGERGHA